MTTTDTGRRTRDQLIEQARRDIGAGPLPSRTALSKSLKTHFNIASEIHEVLTKERRREAARLHKARRLEGPAQEAPRRVGKVTLLPPAPPFIAPSETAVEPVDIALDDPAPEVVAQVPEPVTEAPAVKPRRPIVTWPVLIVAAGAFVAIWAGWVGIGKLTGFGDVNLLPGLVDDGSWTTVNTAITLPLGMEAYSAYAFYVLLHRSAPARARRFAAWSSLGAVVLGMAGQTAYHLMIATHTAAAPWQITTVVSCLPVAVFGLAAALVHMVRAGEES